MTDTITLKREVVQEWHDRIKASSNFNDRESLKMYDLRQEIAAALAAPQPAPIAQPELLKFLLRSYQTGTYATMRHALGTAISAIEGSATVKVEPQPVKQADDWEIRGKLTALKCWHRLTEAEADELVVFTAMLTGAKP